MCAQRLILPVASEVGGAVAEEVVVQYLRYAVEQLGVNAPALEDVIHVLSVAVKLLGEPDYGVAVLAQFLPYSFPDVYHLHHFMCCGTVCPGIPLVSFCGPKPKGVGFIPPPIPP